jgi:hypothetical protein
VVLGWCVKAGIDLARFHSEMEIASVANEIAHIRRDSLELERSYNKVGADALNLVPLNLEARRVLAREIVQLVDNRL